MNLLKALFADSTIRNILHIDLEGVSSLDDFIWLPDSKGKFTVNFFYKLDQSNRFQTDNVTNNINRTNLWKPRTNERHKSLPMRLVNLALPWSTK